MDSPPIVITGAELVTCLGASRAQTWENVVAGRCGMGALTALESPLPAGKLGGQAVDLPADYLPGEPREVRYLKWTIEKALAEAGVLETLPYEAQRCGFMLGTTANAMANMDAVVDRYGAAPRAFLVVPMVGAFFIDFINAVLITVCINLWS